MGLRSAILHPVPAASGSRRQAATALPMHDGMRGCIMACMHGMPRQYGTRRSFAVVLDAAKLFRRVPGRWGC